MLDWIGANDRLIETLISMLLAAVWIVYLQLFLSNYVRQRRPFILINRGAGAGLDARCFIANLGQEPIYVTSVWMTLETEAGPCDAMVTDRKDLSEEDLNNPADATNMGPVQSGEGYAAGRFRDLVSRVLDSSGYAPDTHITALEVMVVAVTASGDGKPCAAKRRYNVIETDEGERLQETTLTAEQIRSFLARRRLAERMRDYLTSS